jgi:hypothetical protein
LKLTGVLTCRELMFVIRTFGKTEAAAVAGASAALVTDFVIAAIPPTASAAEATAAYLRKSLRPPSGAPSSLPGMALRLRVFG